MKKKIYTDENLFNAVRSTFGLAPSLKEIIHYTFALLRVKWRKKVYFFLFLHP
jgi:hypothetical protein